MRVLHVMHSAHPDTSGASIRSRYVVETQAALGIEPVVVTSPFQPPVDARNANGAESLGGVTYHRTFDPRYDHRFMVPRKSLATRARKLTAVLPFARRVRALARAERADLIHGHSLFYCGLAASLAARSLGLPSVYEVRSLIEDTLVQEGGTTARGLLYRAYRGFDDLALRMATHVVTISDGLRTEVIGRGVAPERVTVLGNGVDVERQPPAPRDPGLLARLGLRPDAFVVGYVGTLFAYESLDVLIDALAALGGAVPEIALVVVGDGNARDALVAHSTRLGLQDRVRFVGRVPHEEVGSYYGLVDLFVLPRRPTRLTNLVTPLKPLEIMARGKPLLASDCGGHRELIVEDENGLLYDANDPDALPAALTRLSARRDDLAGLGRRARTWVAAHRSWERMLEPTVALYRALLQRPTGHQAVGVPVAAGRR